MVDQQVPPLKTYRGNCHCTAYVYEIALPEIDTASECNCSICYKKGAIYVFPLPSDVKFVKGDPKTLTSYTFGRGAFSHNFCPTCGNSLTVVGHLTPPKAGENKLPENGFNIRTLQHGQVDMYRLQLSTFDGKSLPPPYQAPKYTGPQPTGKADGGELQTGSCHCGAVTVGLNAKPIDKTTEGLVECNCSICARYGATWTYVPRDQVVIEGRENVGTYFFNNNAAGKLFCKKCGIPVGSEIAQFTDERIAQLNDNTRKWYNENRNLTAINLRIINGLDVKDLNRHQFDGWSWIKPTYTEP